MKMLSDDEIRCVFETAQTKATEWIKNIEESANQAQQETKIYQLRKNLYEEQVATYQKQLKQWEEYEQRKKEIEEEYQIQLAEYEKLKQESEKEGKPFDQPLPTKKYISPIDRPVISLTNKPIPPIKPVLDTPLTILNFNQLSIPQQNKFFFHLSAYTRKQLGKLEYLTADNKNLIHQIMSREFYIQQRVEMEKTAFGSSAIPDGLLGEMLVVFELELCKQAGTKGVILHNLEIEIGNQTIQTDVVFITQKGIFVIESKNFSGKISGAERMNKWVLQTPKRQYNFFNPIMQNRSHINVLTNILPNVKFYSLIAFSERSYLEYIDIHCADTFVCNFYAIKDVINDVFSTDRDSISPQGLNLIAERLRRYSADDPTSNPNFKESRSYFSSRSKIKPSQENTSGNLPPFQLEDFIIE